MADARRILLDGAAVAVEGADVLLAAPGGRHVAADTAIRLAPAAPARNIFVASDEP